MACHLPLLRQTLPLMVALAGERSNHILSDSLIVLLQTPAADSQTGPPPLAAAPAQSPQQQQLQQQAAAAAQLPASPLPPGFMAGMPFPGMLPLPPMLPPGMQAAAGIPGVVPPPFTAAMMQQMQQVRAWPAQTTVRGYSHAAE